MNCCGKTIKNIAAGFAGVAAERLLRLPGGKCDAADERTRTCQRCEFATWLTVAEYARCLGREGVAAVLANLDDLTVLGDLPRRENRPGCKLFCRRCKCWIPAKARIANEKCPENKWSK